VVGLLHLASEPACLGTEFPPFLVKQLYRCDWVVLSSFVRAGYTTRRWGWLLGRVGFSSARHCPLYPCKIINNINNFGKIIKTTIVWKLTSNCQPTEKSILDSVVLIKGPWIYLLFLFRAKTIILCLKSSKKYVL
jgi:hypothetical protein